MQVVFAAASHTSADDLLKRRIRGTRDAPNWTLVSSDHEILNYARSYRMKQMTAARFAQLLHSSSPMQASRGDAIHPKLSEEEIDDWLRAFGGEPE